ncbi:hypothetical protein [Acuticoccus mangrovi]|uniref:Uncharacterized protein n=1 Tax=Acuticoccus mangrovi TaxID=2796142 RepID=A0A934MI93_9HYPH|nr:hypothetical protein [Acuticoccus mangrovi]MBJ3778513.1 hypothetical protein [Acuticoccus mangrovi]
MAALRDALAGKSRCFVPYAWEELPSLVNMSAGPGWWTDATGCRRLLLDLIGATGAHGAVVDILHPSEQRLLADEPGLEGLCDDVLDNPVVADAIDRLSRLAATVQVPLVAALPSFHDGDADLVGDILCDIAGAAMGTGIAAILIAGADGAVAGRIKRLADNFDLPVIVLGEDGAREITRDGAVAVAGDVPAGVVLTPGDVSRSWTLAEIKQFGSAP